MTAIENIKSIVNKNYPDSVVNSILKLPNGYLVSIQPKDWDDDRIIDGYFKIDSSGKMTEYSPVMDPEEFVKAQKNIIYKK